MAILEIPLFIVVILGAIAISRGMSGPNVHSLRMQALHIDLFEYRRFESDRERNAFIHRKYSEQENLLRRRIFRFAIERFTRPNGEIRDAEKLLCNATMEDDTILEMDGEKKTCFSFRPPFLFRVTVKRNLVLYSGFPGSENLLGLIPDLPVDLAEEIKLMEKIGRSLPARR